MTTGSVDGKRELKIQIITALRDETTVSLRVNGDLHVGGLMLKIVEEGKKSNTDLSSSDWSDYGIWWPDRNVWLTRTRSTMDQLEVHADAKLVFTPMHKHVSVLLPDLQKSEMRVNFAASMFGVVVRLCKELTIRHPEELSLFRKLDPEELKRNKGISATRRTKVAAAGKQQNAASDAGSKNDGSVTPGYGISDMVQAINFNANGMTSGVSMSSLSFSDSSLASVDVNRTPVIAAKDAVSILCRPRNLTEKARINAGWLDSSRSLMEQGIRDTDTLLLRYKFSNFFDLSLKYDAARINQIYGHARWSIITEHVDCSEEEMITFAALQLQVEDQMNRPQPDYNSIVDDDVDSALNDLQACLEGPNPQTNGQSDKINIPELVDNMLYYKPKSLGYYKKYKNCWAVVKETVLSIYETAQRDQDPVFQFSLENCQPTTDVNVSIKKFNIKIVLSSTESDKIHLQLHHADRYARWITAIRFAAKGRTMADSGFESEVASVLSMLHLQRTPSIKSSGIGIKDFQAWEYMSEKCYKQLKSAQLNHRISERQANVQKLNLLETKMKYIDMWKALQESQRAYFIVRFKGSKKEEMMAVTRDEMVLLDGQTGKTLKTWRSKDMKSWAVNWDRKQVQVSFENEDVAFQCLTADCKVVHEFIGGYIFLSMRSGDKSQVLNEELFQKLTGGWDD